MFSTALSQQENDLFPWFGVISIYKMEEGVCGADADLIAARHLLRGAAAGAAQHGMHARELILMLKWAAEGKLDLPIIGEY